MMVANESVNLPRILIIGAGPAGVSAALRLKDRGHDSLLVDRSHFPRDKVCGCCLNMSALSNLSRIGCDQILISLAGAPLRLWQMSLGAKRIDADLPGGIALSRGKMDAVLVREAAQRGVRVVSGCEARVKNVDASGVQVELIGFKSETLKLDCNQPIFSTVILATGLFGGGVANWLPWELEPSGPMGVGAILPPNSEVAPGTIHMACGDGGYVGLVQLEDGSVDMAAAIRIDRMADGASNRAAIASQIEAILSHAGWRMSIAEHLLKMTPPLTRKRRIANGRLIAIGDAAQYVEPFTGEGMAWAIESGIEAADCVSDELECGVEKSGVRSVPLADRWAARYHAMQRRRQWVCRAVTYALASPPLTRMMIPAMRFAPWAVRLAIQRINRQSTVR